MKAAILRLEEERRILADNARHLIHGGEPGLSLFHRNNMIAQMTRDTKEITAALRALRSCDVSARPLDKHERAMLAEMGV